MNLQRVSAVLSGTEDAPETVARLVAEFIEATRMSFERSGDRINTANRIENIDLSIGEMS